MILSKEQIERSPEKYVKACDLTELYSVNRVTIWRLLKKFIAVKKYQQSYIPITPRLKLVKLNDFDNFLHENHYSKLKD